MRRQVQYPAVAALVVNRVSSASSTAWGQPQPHCRRHAFTTTTITAQQSPSSAAATSHQSLLSFSDDAMVSYGFDDDIVTPVLTNHHNLLHQSDDLTGAQHVDDETTQNGSTPQSNQQWSLSRAPPALEPIGVQNESLMSAVDMLCDDLFLCKVDVLRQFARSRGIPSKSKVDVVIRLLELAHKEAHGDSADLKHTKRVLGNVFSEEVRTSGLRSQWTNKSLEASHVEQACERHAKFASMANASKRLMVRKSGSEAAKLLRRLTRPFLDEFATISSQAVSGVYRAYHDELQQFTSKYSVTEVVAPYCAYLVANIRHTNSVNLLSRTDATEKLVECELLRPAVEDGDAGTLEQYMSLIDRVVEEVDRRALAYGDNRVNYGGDTPRIILDSIQCATAAAAAFSSPSNSGGSTSSGRNAGGATSRSSRSFEVIPEWVQTFVHMFANWELIVRNDVAPLRHVPPSVFLTILAGVSSWRVLQLIHGELAKPSDIPRAYVQAIKLALTEHFFDEAKVTDALSQLASYVQAPMDRGSRSNVKNEIFSCILQQLQAASHGSSAQLHNNSIPASTGGGAAAASAAGTPSSIAGSQNMLRISLVLREATLAASRCERAFGLYPLMVKMTEDLRFHYRFAEIFKHLNTKDRETVRSSNVNMLKTLKYFEKEFDIEAPISTKAVAFLVIVLTFMASRSGSGGATPAILERFSSVTGKEEFSVVSLAEMAATTLNELKIALPPQLSYNSWLQDAAGDSITPTNGTTAAAAAAAVDSATSAASEGGQNQREKSVYSVVPSAAVKGASNQAMLVSQAPMMRALDAISRVPWRINKYMLHVQEALIREGFGFGKIRPGFYPLHYCALKYGDIYQRAAKQQQGSRKGGGGFYGNRTNSKKDSAEEEDDGSDVGIASRDDAVESDVFNTLQRNQYRKQQDLDWRNLSDLRSSRVHYLQALRQARSLVQFSRVYFPNSMDFRGRMYPIPGRLNHTGSDPFRAMLEYADPKPLGKVGLYWLKVHVANKMGMSKLSFDERVQYVDEHVEDVIQSAESPLHGDKWWQEGAEPMQCLMACKELRDALSYSQGAENFPSRLPVAVDGSYNGLQHYSAIGRDQFGAELVNLVPSERPADAYTGILKEMLTVIQADARKDNQVAQRCLGSGKGLDRNHIKRKTIKRPIMTQVYGVTGYGMTEQILDELVKQNAAHGLWTMTDMKEMAAYLREKVLDSLGVTFRETQQCRKWLTDVTELIWNAQPSETRNAFCWTTPLGLVVRQPYRVRKELSLFTVHGHSKIPGDSVTPASRKQLSALAPNLIHSLDATHLAMTALEMQNRGLSMMAVHDSYWTYACDMPSMTAVLREQFVNLYAKYDPLWELKEQWEESFFLDLRRHGLRLPDPPKRGELDLNVVLKSPYFFS